MVIAPGHRGPPMDLHTITEVVRRPGPTPGAAWQDGDAWLAGGTWLFSEPQPDLRRLVDLTTLGWETLVATDEGLQLGATCTIAELHAFRPPVAWTAGALVATCCEAFLSSFKVWSAATVGGNIAMSLPAGPMITLTVALEASYTIWSHDGAVRDVDAAAFVTGDHRNVLAPGDLLRSVHIPASALVRRHAHRRLSLTQLRRSSVFLIGTLEPGAAELLLTITAGTTHPVRLAFDGLPDAASLRRRLDDEVPDHVYFADANGTPTTAVT